MRVLRTLPGAESVRLLALDTDRSALDSTGLPEENLLLAGEVWRSGRGCGGSEIDGQRAVAHERPKLEELLKDSRFLVVIGGLGGGTASGGAPIVLSVAAKLKVPNIFMMTLPFMLEGPRRRNLAEKVLNESLFEVADAVVTLNNLSGTSSSAVFTQQANSTNALTLNNTDTTTYARSRAHV